MFMTSFNLIYLFKIPFSKYSHILSYQGEALQQMNFGEDTIQSITDGHAEKFLNVVTEIASCH